MIDIYFAGSIRGGRRLAERYREIIDLLGSYGRVYTEHVGDESAIIEDDKQLSDREIHDRDMDWIRKSDLMIAEVSVPSLGVGYEIARAIDLGMPVICLYDTLSEQRLSAMILGCDEITVESYSSLEDVKGIVENFLRNVVNRTC